MSTRSILALAFTLALAGSAGAQGTDPGSFPKTEASDLWRASKLVGVSLYGPDNQRVGSISDVLMSHDGGGKYVVVGVGGFLGIGTKDVAIPFDQIRFTDQPIVLSTVGATSGDAMAPGGAQPAGTMAPATVGLGTTPAVPNGALVDNTPSPARTPVTAYPDHGNISLTRDQLKSAPDFTYAR